MSYAQGAQVKLTAHYEGIGPVFKIKLQLQNLSKKPIHDTHVILNINTNIYKERGVGLTRLLPLMLPNLIYKVDIEVENIDKTGANDMI